MILTFDHDIELAGDWSLPLVSHVNDEEIPESGLIQVDDTLGVLAVSKSGLLSFFPYKDKNHDIGTANHFFLTIENKESVCVIIEFVRLNKNEGEIKMKIEYWNEEKELWE